MKNSIFTVLAALVLYPAGAQPVTPQDRRRAAEKMPFSRAETAISIPFCSAASDSLFIL